MAMPIAFKVRKAQGQTMGSSPSEAGGEAAQQGRKMVACSYVP